MNNLVKKQSPVKWLTLVIMTLGMVACQPDTPEITVFPTETEVVTEMPVESEATQTMPVDSVRSKVVLVYSADADGDILSQTQSTLEQLVSDAGLTLEIEGGPLQELNMQDVKVMVGVGPSLDLSGLAADTQEVVFLAINNPGISSSSNVSVIGDPFVDPRRKSFMIGYLAALISSDNKMAALIPSEIENSDTIVEAFIVGARYYCGICRPQFPPYGTFPQWEIITSTNTAQGFQAVIDNFVGVGIEVLYVHGDLASPEMLSYIAERDIKVIGDSTPDIIRNNWAGTLTSDPGPALIELWPELLLGSGGSQMTALISLTDMETGLISVARYRLFEETAADLESGLISTSPAP